MTRATEGFWQGQKGEFVAWDTGLRSRTVRVQGRMIDGAIVIEAIDEIDPEAEIITDPSDHRGFNARRVGR